MDRRCRIDLQSLKDHRMRGVKWKVEFARDLSGAERSKISSSVVPTTLRFDELWHQLADWRLSVYFFDISGLILAGVPSVHQLGNYNLVLVQNMTYRGKMGTDA